MALQYVGGNNNIANGDQIVSVSLTALTGGISASAAAGDLVIVGSNIVGINTNSPQYPAVTTSGYTSIADLFADDTREVNTNIAYKVMGGSPDTSVMVGNLAGNAGGPITAAVHVWRGVNPSGLFDATTTTATGIDSTASVPPAITPVSPGTVIVVMGTTSTNTNNFVITSEPSGYSNFQVSAGMAASGYGSTAFASKAWTSGTETPGGFGTSGTNASSSWTGVTIALKEGGQEFTVNESVALSEAVSALRARVSSTSESLSMVEGGSYVLGKVFAITETLGLTEAFTSAMTFIFSAAESLGLVEFPYTLEKKWNNISKTGSLWLNGAKSSTGWAFEEKSDTDWTNPPKS